VANIKSQIKRNRQTLVRTERNKAVRSGVKTALRKFRSAVESGDADQARGAYRDATATLDKAVSKGVLHKNNAANKKSRMAKALERL
jgi:small subunit ribosomal protein S20